MRNDNPLVYSTELGRLCPACANPESECTCKKQTRPVGSGAVRVGRESKGRKGKTVTLVTGLALAEEPMKILMSELKRHCGAGGALKDGVIEIQGDHREALLTYLKKKGYPVKMTGG
jgi:translation initiation factor 1